MFGNILQLMRQAQQAGYTADQILQFLGSQNQQVNRGVRGALQAGYTAEQIVQYLGNNTRTKNKKTLERHVNAQDRYLSSIGLKNKEERAERRNKYIGGAMAAAGVIGGLGAYALGRAAPAAVRGQLLPAVAGQTGRQAPRQIGQQTINVGPARVPVQPNRPQLGGPPLQTPGSQGGIIRPPQGPQPTLPASPLNSETTPQQTYQPPQQMPPMPGPPTPQETALQNIERRRAESAELFELAQQPRVKKEHMTPFMRTARALIKKGDIKDVEMFDHFRKYWQASEGKPRGSPLVEFEKFRVGLPREQAQQEVTSTVPTQEMPDVPSQEPSIQSSDMEMPEMPQQGIEGSIPTGKLTPSMQQASAEKIKGLQPQASAMLPDGRIGTIESIKNGIAKIKVDGKEAHRRVEDLEESPISEKDLADLWDEMISGIEEETDQEVSKNVFWAGYDPKKNELAYIPHGGALYTYMDISPEDAKALTDVLTLRKTSGSNYIGVWKKGTKSPIGAAMSALIKKLQAERGGKGNEYSGKYLTTYSAVEPAAEASKRKHAAKKRKVKPS